MTDVSVKLKPAGHYTAQAAIVWCFDNRAWDAFQRFLDREDIRTFDPILIAGGAKDLASPEQKSNRQYLLDQIAKSIKLHHTKKIVLMTHEDCGAYGGSQKFGNDAEKEKIFHQSELEKAKQVLLRAFPDMEVQTVYLGFNGLIRIK